MEIRTFKCISLNEWCKARRVHVSYAIYVVPEWIDTEAKHSGIGCHIGRTYWGVFCYADDLAIVSPTLFGLRQMIEICEEYYYSTQKKSKILCY